MDTTQNTVIAYVLGCILGKMAESIFYLLSFMVYYVNFVSFKLLNCAADI